MPPGKLLHPSEGDSELFLLVKNSDVHAFAKLYNRYWPSLVSIANKRLQSREKAEDIVQNIFIDLYNRRGAINLAISLRAYLHQALKFKVLNEYRSQVVRARYQQRLFFRQMCEIDFAYSLEEKELQKNIEKALDELPEKCKQVFLLSRRENLSNKDISASLNITIATVEKHITRALKTLKGQIQPSLNN